MTQKEMVLRHLEDYESISTFEAFMEYGITRLSGRIFELRADGHKIVSERHMTRNRYGKPCHYDRYRLEK